MSVRAVEHNYARNILIQMGVVALLLLGAVVWQREFIANIYLHNQLTRVGWVINGGILLLFLSGLVRLVRLFLRYSREEKAINRFILNLRQNMEPDYRIPVDAMIAERYTIMKELKEQNALFNHSALAATLVASESSRISFPKFVNNVLILTGVFGTIVSLSIALLGASDMITAATEIGSLGSVIHGMSTALSTTMTAIVAYLFFGYFFLRLTDTQTYLISRVEDVTSTMLIPRFQVQPESLLKDYSDMVRSAAALVQRLDASQQKYAEVAARLENVVNASEEKYQQNAAGLEEATAALRSELGEARHGFDRIIHLLAEGFRLSERE